MTYTALFSGQGSQVAGMGRSLTATSPAARDVFAAAGETLRIDMVHACEDRAGELSDPRFVQPALVTYALAAQAAVREATGETPVAAVGHSLGELAALGAAGMISQEDAVALAWRRGELMAACEPGAMAVVFGVDAGRVDEICAQIPGSVVVATRNLPDQCVISGQQAAVRLAATRLVEAAAVVRPLAITVAAHSPLMERAVVPWREALLSVSMGQPRFPVVSSTLARPFGDADDVVRGLSAALVTCVDWPGAVSAMCRLATGPLVEMGPKTVLRDLTTSLTPGATAWSVGVDGLALIAQELRRSADDPGAGHGSAESELATYLRLVVGTPTVDLLDDVAVRGLKDRFDALRSLLCDARTGDARPEVVERGLELTLEMMAVKGHDLAAANARLAATRRLP